MAHTANIRINEFLGRESELLQLQEAWTSASRGEPQWVSIVGETGTGKTRLVQELYRWLAVTQQALPYWPASLVQAGRRAPLNPDSSSFPTDAEELTDMPWLWWGLRGLADPYVRNGAQTQSALTDALAALEPHLAWLLWQDARARQNVEAAKEVGKKLLGLMVGPVVEPLIGVAELLAASRGPLTRLLTRLKIPISDVAQKNKASAAERIYRSLYEILKVQKSIILVLDDAHWLDGETLSLVELIARKAADDKLKLLTISTSWAGEWLNCDAARIFHATGIKRHEIELRGLSSDYVRAAVLAQYPSLAQPDQDVFIDRANGNLRYLEELMMLADEGADEYFEDGHRGGPLSESGRKQLLEDTVEMDQLVQRRFRALLQETRQALMLGSFQGPRFVDGLVSEVAGLLQDQSFVSHADVTKAVELAKTIVFDLQPDIHEFLHGPYHKYVFSQLAGKRHLSDVQRAYAAVIRRYVRELRPNDVDAGLSDALQSQIEKIIALKYVNDPAERLEMLAWAARAAHAMRRHVTTRRFVARFGQELRERPRVNSRDWAQLDEKARKARLFQHGQFPPVDDAIGVLRAAIDIGYIEFGRRDTGYSELCGRLEGTLLDGESKPIVNFKSLECLEVLKDFYRMAGLKGDAYNKQLEYVELLAEIAYTKPLGELHLKLAEALIEMAELHARYPSPENLGFCVNCQKEAKSLLTQLLSNEAPEALRKQALILWSWRSAVANYFLPYIEERLPQADVSELKVSIDETCTALRTGIELDSCISSEELTQTLRATSFSELCGLADGRLSVVLHVAALTLEASVLRGIPLAGEFVDFTMGLVDAVLRSVDEGGYIDSEIVTKALRAAIAAARLTAAREKERLVSRTPDWLPGNFEVIRVAGRSIQPGEYLGQLAVAKRIADRCKHFRYYPAELVAACAELCYRIVAMSERLSEIEVSSLLGEILHYAEISDDAVRISRDYETPLVLSWFKATIETLEVKQWQPMSVVEDHVSRARLFYEEAYDYEKNAILY